MSNILNGIGNAASSAANSVGGFVSGAVNNALNNQNNFSAQDFQQNGFIVPPIPSADGNGLPSSKIASQQTGVPVRNIIRWYVPEVGLINMFVNPQSIRYSFKKLINPERTKGGYVVQYGGEEFATLSLAGHTGSSGVNGLNVLYEIYRAEQFLYDPIALTMAADNSITGLNDIIDSALGNLGGLGSTIASATTGLFGLDPASQNVLPRNVPSLASLATGIEMYYAGWVFRGYFNSFNFTESAERLGLFDYNIEFTITQRRGYRVNSLAWQHSAIDGPSGWGSVPLSITSIQPSSSGLPPNTTVAASGREPFAD